MSQKKNQTKPVVKIEKLEPKVAPSITWNGGWYF